ncbi:MAG: Gfo/Idh/MocA family oxidoreductase [Ruminococcaceae bacterium]|nr:Gfo/Idh/MocA family oxidoreductase [Oscillospiraceae bacterium]
MKPIRIALIGANRNSHCVQIHTRIQQLTELFEVVGIAYPENEEQLLPGKVERIGDLPRLTVEQILCDPTIEAVAVETDEIYCTKYALMAAKAGKHVHMEKPGGRELADFEELIATVKEKNLIFCPGYMYRYNPYVQELFAAVQAGELGQIQYVEAQMNCIHTPESRQWLSQFEGGMLFFLGCHLVDLIYRLQGMPQKVIPLSCRSGIGESGEDHGMVVLQYPGGVSFARTTATELGGYRRRQLVVTGTKATWELKPLEWGKEAAMTTKRNISSERAWSHPGVDSETEPFDRYIPMLTHFARCVRGEIENEFTPDYELELFKLLLTCCKPSP